MSAPSGSPALTGYELQRLRVAELELRHALIVLGIRRPGRAAIGRALAATLHAAALLSHVEHELRTRLDPWKGRGNPWLSL